MKILLIGTTGQVGWALQRSLHTLGTVIPANRSGTELQVDLADSTTIRSAIREVKPNVIINAAAYTAVDRAETETELAMQINGIAPGVLAEEASRAGALLVHYSTDYVFDGNRSQPYRECSLTNPQSAYGVTKLSGERAIQAIDGAHLILRTSWVYGWHGKNFLRTMLMLSQEREELNVVDDQIGAPTWSGTIASATAQIVAQGRSNIAAFGHEHRGIYHLTSTSETSWYGFAKTIFELTNRFETGKLDRLNPVPSTQYASPVKRPAYSCLDTSKLCSTFGLTMPHWNVALELVLSNFR